MGAGLRRPAQDDGIPLLHPWANRLSRRSFRLGGREVAIDPDATPLRLDEGGLPMHGLLSAATGWEVVRHDDAGLAATFDFAAHDALIAPSRFRTGSTTRRRSPGRR